MNLNNLKKRSLIIRKIRKFFEDRNILEVETQLLSQGTITDPNIISLETNINGLSTGSKKYYLQTSPEFAMKRLLCAGSGSIFQICKAFRDGEAGHRHNPEFTMLEWYRLDFNHHDLMHEVDEFLQFVLQSKPAEKLSYRDAFMKYCNLDPFKVSIEELKEYAKEKNIFIESLGEDKDGWLNLLISHCVEPNLGIEKPLFLYDFPASQAALAKIRHDEFPVAERFEVFINAMEIGNGFHELANAEEQRKRFENDLQKRSSKNIAQVNIDENFLEALENGLPECSGIAIGIDRLVMLALQTNSIKDVIAFTCERA